MRKLGDAQDPDHHIFLYVLTQRFGPELGRRLEPAIGPLRSSVTNDMYYNSSSHIYQRFA